MTTKEKVEAFKAEAKRVNAQRPGRSGDHYKYAMKKFKDGFPPRNVLGPFWDMSGPELKDMGRHIAAAGEFVDKTWRQVIDKIDPANISPVKLQKFFDAYMKLYNEAYKVNAYHVRKLGDDLQKALKALATK